MEKPEYETTKHFDNVYNTVVFTSEDSANAFMENNEVYGLLKVEKGKIYLAKLYEVGERIGNPHKF